MHSRTIMGTFWPNGMPHRVAQQSSVSYTYHIKLESVEEI